jgi:hypothetical protein
MQTATRPNRQQMAEEALTRAATGQSLSNWPAIIHGFIAKGIPESDIRPRENVFTFHAWRALGRQVRRGEHGVKVVTYVSCDRAEPQGEDCDGVIDEPRKAKRSFRRPWTATVFHVSQTDPIAS